MVAYLTNGGLLSELERTKGYAHVVERWHVQIIAFPLLCDVYQLARLGFELLLRDCR